MKRLVSFMGMFALAAVACVGFNGSSMALGAPDLRPAVPVTYDVLKPALSVKTVEVMPARDCTVPMKILGLVGTREGVSYRSSARLPRLERLSDFGDPAGVGRATGVPYFSRT